MKPLNVDFRTRLGPSRPLWLALGVAVASVAVATAITLGRYGQANTLRSELVAMADKGSAPDRAIEVESPPRYLASARELLEESASPWPALLVALEAVRVSGISVASVDVAPAERMLRLEVHFTDYDALLRYVAELNAGEPFPRWTLVRAQAKTAGMAPRALLQGSLAP